jgi:ABC-type transporter Mla MlaB component
MSAFQVETTDTAATVRLDGELTVEEARALQFALRTALLRPRTLTIEASALARIDLAALQVLLAAAHGARTHVAPGAAPAWAEALARFGLAAAFSSN